MFSSKDKTELLEQLALGKELSTDQMVRFLLTDDKELVDALIANAYSIKQEVVGARVYFRGIIEFSNYCNRNCTYCGIRRDNDSVDRYTISSNEIVTAAVWAWEQKYGSIVLQSGERTDNEFIEKVTRILSVIKERTNNDLRVTLSLGEQKRETYQKWFDAGAHRYLLRIETGNDNLYRELHPDRPDLASRIRNLEWLREIGYQVGTGIMIGLPNQTAQDLASDIQLFKKLDVDMLGMGPYLRHADTPMAKQNSDIDKEKQLDIGLRMIALARIALRDINIAATTALQALKFNGRELGLRAGANVIMPNVTPTEYREGYQLYDNKPCLDENAGQCQACLDKRVRGIGETIAFGEWGDAKHFLNRTCCEVV